MSIFSGFIVFLLIWWTALFAVLPLGIKQNAYNPEEAMPGAPEDPQIKKKIIITTAVSAILWLIIFALIQADIISFRELAQTMHEQDQQ